jgi:hypothetical protein
MRREGRVLIFYDHKLELTVPRAQLRAELEIEFLRKNNAGFSRIKATWIFNSGNGRWEWILNPDAVLITPDLPRPLRITDIRETTDQDNGGAA